METILATAFGRKVDVQGGEADELTRAAQAFFNQAEEGELSSRDVLIMMNSECRMHHTSVASYHHLVHSIFHCSEFRHIN